MKTRLAILIILVLVALGTAILAGQADPVQADGPAIEELIAAYESGEISGAVLVRAARTLGYDIRKVGGGEGPADLGYQHWTYVCFWYGVVY